MTDALFTYVGGKDRQAATEEINRAIKEGKDRIILAIPFSDPIGSGDVTQEELRALAGGGDIALALDIARRVKASVHFCLATYANPAFKFGYENLCRACREGGISEILIYDFPLEEREEILPFTDKYGLTLISCVPACDCARTREIAAQAKGFIYVAGKKEGIKAAVKAAGEVTCVPCFADKTL